MIINELANYVGSRDYARLAELAKTGGIICIVDGPIFYEKRVREVAHTSYEKFPDESEFWQISCRRTSYVYAESVEEFISRCQKENVEFIEPER